MAWRLARSLAQLRDQITPKYQGAGLLARLIIRVGAETEDGCWPWIGGTRSNGYGTFAVKRDGKWTQTTAHRVSYELFTGSIPDGFEVDHLCRNRACVNPAHLEAVTLQENRRRRNESQICCRNGHPYTAESVRICRDGDGYQFRQCQPCREAYRLEHRRAA